MKRIVLPLGTLIITALGWLPAVCGHAEAQEGCPVVGIKSEGAYYTARERSCFANARRASRRGFLPASAASVVRGASFDLKGSEEVPPVTTMATGSCITALLSDKVTLKVMCVHDLASVTAAHVHDGKIGEDGAVICPLGTGASPISATCTLTAAQVGKLLDGSLYVNVHSAANPDGELRGQID